MGEIIGKMADSINVGVDVDGTLTKGKIDRSIFGLALRDAEKGIMDFGPKDGIDILLDTCHNIYIITGRQERFLDVTKDWLDMYGIPYRDITMFPDNFYFDGYDVSKYANLKLDIHIRKNIHVSLDDNEHVVCVLNRAGIMTCKVNDNFRDAFEKVLRNNIGI